MKIVVIFSLIFLSIIGAFAQSRVLQTKEDSLIDEISKLQSKGNAFYKNGMFASQRGKHKKEDNTIFFSSLIVFTLNNNSNKLSAKGNDIKDSVCKRVISNYHSYKNTKGLNTFNFWQTNPPQFFPNSKYLSRHAKYNIPDDADCTSLIYMTDTLLDTTACWLKNKLITHANLASKKIKNTYKEYRNCPAYTTWFGKNMPLEFDICVQTNILYFILENKLPLNKNDSATINLIKSIVKSGRYISNSYYVSPSYRKPSIVLYHLARLLGKYNVAELNDCRAQIKNNIEKQLSASSNFMEKVILSSSLMRMGGNPQVLVYPPDLEKQMNEFSFFQANLFSSYARPCLKFITKHHRFTVPYYCKAYNLALLLEYEDLKK